MAEYSLDMSVCRVDFKDDYGGFLCLDKPINNFVRWTTQHPTLIPISQPEIIYAFNPGYPDTTFSGSILTFCETEIVDISQMFLLFATDAREQTLEEKMVERKFVLGDGQSCR